MPESTVPILRYEADEFGGPRNVTFDGHPVRHVQRIEIRQGVQEFNEVVITFGGLIVETGTLT